MNRLNIAGMTSSLLARSLVYCALVAVGGCGQGPAAPPIAVSGEAPARPLAHFYGNDWMYASQPASNQVLVYRRNRHDLTLTYYETMTSGFSAPLGMVATPDGDWYVANSGSSNVLVYSTTRHGPQGPIATLRDDGNVPVNVAATPNHRLVAVSNGSTTGSGAGSVSVYVNGRHTPARTLTYGSHPIRGAGIALDASGNCYWSFNDPRTLSGSIVKFAGCKGSGTSFVSGIVKAGGLAFDKSGNLYYVDQLFGVYKCVGAVCHLITPIGIGGLILPTNINFDDGTPANLWLADAGGSIDALNFEGLILYLLQIIGGVLDPPVGIAPAPGS